MPIATMTAMIATQISAIRNSLSRSVSCRARRGTTSDSIATMATQPTI